MTEIAYLFGAGASSNTLPMVADIPPRMNTLVQNIFNLGLVFSMNEVFVQDSNESKDATFKQFLIDLQWLQSQASYHASVDTLAKKFFLMGSEDFSRLKRILNCYIALEEVTNPYETRYDAFYASLLKQNSCDFPGNIKILSWNYDNQFEHVYSQYTDQDFMRSTDFLSIRNKFNDQYSNDNKFCIYKLNGRATYRYNGKEFPLSNKKSTPVNQEIVEEILGVFVRLKNYGHKYDNCLSFAWEPDEDFLQRIKAVTHNSEVLVVIGYSFPFFNRDIDRLIIGGWDKLRKVYFQNPSADDVKERFMAISDKISSNNLISYKNCDQFLLPNEL